MPTKEHVLTMRSTGSSWWTGEGKCVMMSMRMSMTSTVLMGSEGMAEALLLYWISMWRWMGKPPGSTALAAKREGTGGSLIIKLHIIYLLVCP